MILKPTVNFQFSIFAKREKYKYHTTAPQHQKKEHHGSAREEETRKQKCYQSWRLYSVEKEEILHVKLKPSTIYFTLDIFSYIESVVFHTWEEAYKKYIKEKLDTLLFSSSNRWTIVQKTVLWIHHWRDSCISEVVVWGKHISRILGIEHCSQHDTDTCYILFSLSCWK